MMPFPNRDDVAVEQIIGACGRDHDIPGRTRLEATATETDEGGQTININRTACRKCGMIRVTRWRAPEPDASGTFLALATYERPEPGDVPGITERALQVTEKELADFIAARGFPGGIPAGFAPDRRATAAEEHLDLTLRIRAGQFTLLDRARSLGDILPVPAYAESAGLIDAVPGAALFWPPVQDGDLSLAVTISPTPPEPAPAYDRIAELSCRFHTGRAVLRELAGRELPLPPLPAGHGDYRLRFHAKPSGCLLQIWNQPRTRPKVLVSPPTDGPG
ncbi:hypothetical protein HUT06_01425 [Actinomadura sp. NAK00032]|uniref:hypothetical protein n=1 Tax=Actinomadura sp. NAK00032 TaxID=2742128 RepID=UPI001591252C|nr:hypothetical protein [Actinomadura sp. NAK00032]QKW32861.1 hypothetical protein HUT06_01425 [Actinomadura sp. NAK00032]